MATNKAPWVRNLGGAAQPFRILVAVAAGSSQAIKKGEICKISNPGQSNEAAAPVSGASDNTNLVVCDREQKADDKARMIEFIVPRPDDEFEFALDSARAVAVGETFAISDSETLTYATSNVVARQSSDQNAPNPSENDTTRRSASKAHVCFAEGASYWAAINGNS